MATINYKEKYEKAVQAAMLAKQDTESAVTIGILEEIFPELKESEDERIRKLLVEAVTQVLQDRYCSNRGVSKEKVIAWLEKQGKKTKPIEGFNTEFERQVSCLIASAMNKDYEYTKDFVKWTSDALLNYAKLEIEKNSMGISEATKKKLEDNLNKALEKETPESWNKFLEKQGEQNPIDKYKEWYDFIRWFVKQRTDDYNLIPSRDDIHKWGDNILNHARKVLEQNTNAWSKEDERCLTNAIDACKQMSDEDYDYSQSYIDAINFLKSLKDRYTWKPSDEQMKAIGHICDGNYNVDLDILDSIYRDFKKLRK